MTAADDLVRNAAHTLAIGGALLRAPRIPVPALVWADPQAELDALLAAVRPPAASPRRREPRAGRAPAAQGWPQRDDAPRGATVASDEAPQAIGRRAGERTWRVRPRGPSWNTADAPAPSEPPAPAGEGRASEAPAWSAGDDRASGASARFADEPSPASDVPASTAGDMPAWFAGEPSPASEAQAWLADDRQAGEARARFADDRQASEAPAWFADDRQAGEPPDDRQAGEPPNDRRAGEPPAWLDDDRRAGEPPARFADDRRPDAGPAWMAGDPASESSARRVDDRPPARRGWGAAWRGPDAPAHENDPVRDAAPAAGEEVATPRRFVAPVSDPADEQPPVNRLTLAASDLTALAVGIGAETDAPVLRREPEPPRSDAVDFESVMNHLVTELELEYLRLYGTGELGR